MRHVDSELHVRGESEYVDDVHPPAGMLHAVVLGSPVAHGRVQSIDIDAAKSAPGVHAVLLQDDIPGNPVIGPILQDEVLLARDEVCFVGHPIAIIVADTRELAVHARRRIRLEIDDLPIIVDPREAFSRGDLIAPPRTISMGDVDAAWGRCGHVIEGRCDMGGQEHVPLETNRARAIAREDGQVTVWSSTQSPYAGQKAIARILDIPQHKVEVDVKRLGGGFGGKEDQATHWACMAALAARLLQRPVELVLHREEDIRMTGKRHPYSSDFKIGLDEAGSVLAYEAMHYQNSGAFADLSMPVLERTLLHSTNSYFIPNVKIAAACCRTNLAPNTAFRGFGGPQGMFVIESAIARAAEVTGIPREEIQARNLLQDGDSFYYGQKPKKCRSRHTWDKTATTHGLQETRERVEQFNEANFQFKKGFAMMPVCFGISFTKTFLNQGSALVHVYTDGSVSVSTGGIEMGQGVSTNMISVAARTFGIAESRVKSESTNTTRIANMSPSAASATTDLNGNAVLMAVKQIQRGLHEIAAENLGCEAGDISIRDEVVFAGGKPAELNWSQLVQETYIRRKRLSAHGFYATPDIHFDGEQGSPFAYHSYGACLVEVTVDCLRGTYEVESAKIVHDLGRPINELVDRGQIEGGFVQGLGWMTMEDLVFDASGRYTSGALSTYKLPDVYSTPDDLQVTLLDPEDNEHGPLGSKAVGEPPFMYGIGVFFALRNAIKAFAPESNCPFVSPLTPERVLLNLYPDRPRP